MKIKIDHTDQDPDSITTFEQPKPGLYQAVIDAATVRFRDGVLRDIEVVLKITNGRYEGSKLWDYPSFSEAAKWRLDQFLLATGLLTREKRVLSVQSEKELQRQLTGKKVAIRVKGSSYNDEYRARVSQYIVPGQGTEDDDEDEDETMEELEAEPKPKKGSKEEVDVTIPRVADDDDDEDNEFVVTKDLVTSMTVKALHDLAEEIGLAWKGIAKTDLQTLILEELELTDEDDADVPF